MSIIYYKILCIIENMKIKFVKRMKEWLSNKSCHNNKIISLFLTRKQIFNLIRNLLNKFSDFCIGRAIFVNLSESRIEY